jgi:hypothetical protein
MELAKTDAIATQKNLFMQSELVEPYLSRKIPRPARGKTAKERTGKHYFFLFPAVQGD